jgi:hypothetical protein
VETVFNHRGVNILFIDFNGREQASRDIFQAVIQRGVCFGCLSLPSSTAISAAVVASW